MQDDRIIPTIEDRKPETAATRAAKLKKERVPLYNQKALMYTDKEPGYTYRMVNDTPGRIQRFLKAGWELVKGAVEDTYSGKGRKEASSQGSYITRTVDPNHQYSEGHLMRIRTELYEQDQLAKEAALDRLEEELDANGKLTIARQLGPRANLHIK